MWCVSIVNSFVGMLCISTFIDREVLSRFEPVGGVRIEDVVLITPDGAENLTIVRSDVDWVEEVCSGKR